MTGWQTPYHLITSLIKSEKDKKEGEQRERETKVLLMIFLQEGWKSFVNSLGSNYSKKKNYDLMILLSVWAGLGTRCDNYTRNKAVKL